VGAGESPPVHSPESDSSQVFGTTLAPVADARPTTAAVFSKQERQRRLTSLLDHLTVHEGAPDHELPTATALPVLWVGEPGQMRRVDNASIGRRFAWLFVLAGVTGALVGWGTILQLPLLVRHGLPQDNTGPLVAANVQSTTRVAPIVHDGVPQENTGPQVVASVQSTTGVAPLGHDSRLQQNTEPPVTANLQSGTVAPRLIHDSLPQEKLPVATNAQSITEEPPLIHDSLPGENMAPPVAVSVQSTTEVPPLVRDSLRQENMQETSPVQAQNHQLSQSSASSQVHDAAEIAALLQRGKDFAAHGDLISARLLLQRAAEAGNAEAAQALGETFDPLVFRRLGVIGITPDAASAQKWYERAAELGSPVTSRYLAKPNRSP